MSDHPSEYRVPVLKVLHIETLLKPAPPLFGSAQKLAPDEGGCC